MIALAALGWTLGIFAGGQSPTPTSTPAAPDAASTPAASATASTPAPATTPGPATKAETPRCADCHTELVAAFAGNPHTRQARGATKPDIESFCATCHGDGTKHAESGGDATLIQKFRAAAGGELCLSCHDKANEHASFSTGIHSNSETVNCLTCHSVHKATPRSEFLLAKEPGALCQTCHTTQSASFRNKPFAHRLDRGGMTCLDCHDPHDRKGRVVRLTRQGEPACLNCHADLRGPFVFDHVTGSAGDCLSCHEPHGSSNPKMLVWARVEQLCLSCHSRTGGPNTLGSQPPSFHDLTLPRFRNCTTCHVAVHGSNLSPQLLK